MSQPSAPRPTDALLAARVLDYFRQRFGAEGVRPEQITPESTLEQDLGADSLDMVDMVMELEDRFGVTLADREAEAIRTVGDAVELVVRQVNAQRAA